VREGDGATGRWGDRAMRRQGDWATGRKGERAEVLKFLTGGADRKAPLPGGAGGGLDLLAQCHNGVMAQRFKRDHQTI
jgi:hypothetical protein